MAKKLGWSFTIDANVEVQQDKLNKASKILESFYDKYEDRSLQVDTSDLIKSVKQGVAVIQDLYADGTKDATSWLNIRPEMKKQMEGILSDAEEMFSNIHVLFNNGERVSGLSNIIHGFNEQLAVSFADINGAYDDLVDKQRNLANVLEDFSISDSDDVYDIRNRIDLLEELIEVQKEMATMNPALKTKDLVGRNSVGVLENSLEYYKEALDEMAKYELQTYDQLQKHREIFANLDFDYDDERHEDIKGYEWYDSGIDELETAIENRKTAIELLREYSNDLPVDYDISKYINQAMGDIGRFESYLKELKTLRGDDEPIISGDTFGGNLTEVVEELGKIEQAIRDVLVAFQPLTDALSSEDSAISKFVNSSVEDLNRLQAAFKETFDDIKALSQKEFVNQTIFQGGGKSSGPNKTTQLKSETQELYRQVKLLEKDAYQIVGIFNDNRINLDKVLGISETFKLLEQEDFASKLNSNNYQALNAIMAKLQTAKQELIEFNSLLNTSGLGAKWNADYATKSKYTNRSFVGNRYENVDVDFGNVENKITEFRQNIENELSSVRQRINDIFSFTNLNPDYTAIETITENIYQKFIELQTRINNIEFTIQTPKVVSDTVDTGDASSADTAVTDQTGILAKIKTLSEQIEGELASIRSKIEETFNFATVNPNLGGITEITEKIYQQFVELQSNIKKLDFGSEVASKATEGVDQTSGVNSEKLINEIKSLRAQIEPELQTLRQKIEETFDFSTINPSLDNVTTVIDKVYRHFEELQNQINKLQFKIAVIPVDGSDTSTSDSVSELDKEADSMQEVGDKADSAASKKKKFAAANEEVESSAQDTIGDLEEEAEAMDEIADKSTEAAKKVANAWDKTTLIHDAGGDILSYSQEKTVDYSTRAEYYTPNQETGELELSTVKFIDNFKKRADAAEKTATKIKNANADLREFISMFDSKTNNMGKYLKGYDKLSKFKIENLDQIDEAVKLMTDLNTEYNKVTKSFRQGTKSMNPFVNAITGLDEMGDKIKSAKLSFDSLSNKPEELSEKVKSLDPLLEQLNSFIAVDQNGKKSITNIYGLADAYGQLNVTLRQVNSAIALKRKEERIKSSKGNKKEQELNALYKERSFIITNIIQLTKRLNSLKTAKAKARVKELLDAEEFKLLDLDEQLEQKYGKSLDKSKTDKQDARLIRAGVDVAATKQEASKMRDYNLWFTRRGDAYEHILTLKKQLAKADGEQEKAAIQKEIKEQEKLIEVLSKKLDKYKDISLQQKTADQEYRYRNKDEWRQSQQEIADAASSDKDQTTKQKQDYEEILMLVQKIFTAKKELSKMNSDTSGAVHTSDIERATNAMNEYAELLKDIFGIDIEQLGATIDKSGLLTQEQKNKLLKEERDYKEEIAKIKSRAADKTATREAKQKTGYGKTIYNREAKYFDTIAANERSFADIGLSDDFLAKIEKYKTAFKELQQLREKFANDPSAFDDAGLKNQFQDSALAVEKLRKEILSVFKESKKLADLSDEDLFGIAKIDQKQFTDLKTAMVEFAAETMNGEFVLKGFNAAGTEMYGTLETEEGAIQKVTVALDKGTNSLYAYKSGTEQVTNSWKGLWSSLKGDVRSIITQYVGFHEALQAVRQGVSYVKEIDLAMTELKKVTDATDATYKNFLKTASSVSSVIGSTVSDFTDATAAFARLGYSIDESTKMAETAIVYKNVADGLDTIEESTESIISTMMAYGITADDTMSIIDRFNAVGNNFAITSAGIGDAMQRSASALKEGGNTIDESIALITAANSVIQNPEQVGEILPSNIVICC